MLAVLSTYLALAISLLVIGSQQHAPVVLEKSLLFRIMGYVMLSIHKASQKPSI